jgi:hypothetical protein
MPERPHLCRLFRHPGPCFTGHCGGDGERCDARPEGSGDVPSPPLPSRLTLWARMVMLVCGGTGEQCGMALAAVSGQFPKHRRHLRRPSHSFHDSPSVGARANPSKLRGAAFCPAGLGLRLRCGSVGRSSYKRMVPPNHGRKRWHQGNCLCGMGVHRPRRKTRRPTGATGSRSSISSLLDHLAVGRAVTTQGQRKRAIRARWPN